MTVNERLAMQWQTPAPNCVGDKPLTANGRLGAAEYPETPEVLTEAELTEAGGAEGSAAPCTWNRRAGEQKG
jgi:hypothetical protein